MKTQRDELVFVSAATVPTTKVVLAALPKQLSKKDAPKTVYVETNFAFPGCEMVGEKTLWHTRYGREIRSLADLWAILNFDGGHYGEFVIATCNDGFTISSPDELCTDPYCHRG